MTIKKNMKDLISGAVSSAAMQERDIKATSNTDTAFKKKMIQLPLDLDSRIKKVYSGTCSSYIMMAIHEKLKRDES